MAATNSTSRSKAENAVVRRALSQLSKRIGKSGEVMGNAGPVMKFLRLQLAGNDREQFGVLFLDARNALIKFEVLFTGTVTEGAVYPREIARRALALNAVSVIVAHNHPSGSSQPSGADIALTQKISAAMDLVQIRLLDHIVVGAEDCRSLNESNLMPGGVHKIESEGDTLSTNIHEQEITRRATFSPDGDGYNLVEHGDILLIADDATPRQIFAVALARAHRLEFLLDMIASAKSASAYASEDIAVNLLAPVQEICKLLDCANEKQSRSGAEASRG